MIGGYIKFLRAGAYGDKVMALENDGSRWRWWMLVVNADRTVFPGLISEGGLRPYTELDIINMTYKSNEHKTLPDKVIAWERDKKAYLAVGLLKSTQILGEECLWNTNWHIYQDKFSPKKKSCSERFFKSWMDLDEKDRLVFLYLIYQFRPTGIIETFENAVLERKVVKLIEEKDSKFALLGSGSNGLKTLSNGFGQITEVVGETLSATSKKKPNPDVKKTIDYFRAAYQKRHGVEYLVSWGKDGAVMTRLLEIHSVAEVNNFIERFMTDGDEFVEKAGRTIGIFSTQINKLAGKKGSEIDYSQY